MRMGRDGDGQNCQDENVPGCTGLPGWDGSGLGKDGMGMG